jgi:hypothetical protein
MSSLQNKLYNYEQTPPAKVWEKIVDALDESHITNEFPSKIYNTEAAPPIGAWDKIASSLEAENAAIPMARRGFPFLRYAAAAAVIGLVTFGIIKWMGGKNEKAGERMAVSPDSTRDNKKTDLPEENNTATNTNSEKENIIPEEYTPEVITTEQEKVTRIKKVKSKYSIPDNLAETEPIYAYNENMPNLADRYIMLMTPGGDIIRVSKKWGNLVCCVSGQEQDEDCKDQLKKWQEKIACSPVTTSPGNFMDILNLVSSLNENDL